MKSLTKLSWQGLLQIKTYVLAGMLLFSVSAFGTTFPTISGISPLVANAGSTITITGTNFSTTVANNVVYFGIVKGTVTSATSTTLKVTVPPGASYGSISVTVGGKTAYSTVMFNQTFSCGGALDTSGFEKGVSFSTGGSSPEGGILADLDGDGLADLVEANNSSNTISVFLNKNTTTGLTTSSFASPQIIRASGNPFMIATGDLNGDGLLDIVVGGFSTDSFSILENTSTPGHISFATPVKLQATNNVCRMVIFDMDGDGLPDIVMANRSKFISIWKNNGAGSPITASNFTKTDLTVSSSAQMNDVAVADMDGDGKMDIVTSDLNSTNMYVFLNNGSLSFTEKNYSQVTNNVWGLCLADIDGDGKPDISGAYRFGTKMFVYHNTTSGGTFSLASETDIATPTGSTVLCFSVADLNGDGKPDLIGADLASKNGVIIVSNNSTPGTLSFGTPFGLLNKSQALVPCIGDIDGDGKPDIFIQDNSSKAIGFRNKTGPYAKISPSGNKSICSTDSFKFTAVANSGVTYQWNLNGSPITNATGSFYYAKTPGSYTLTVLSDTCYATSTPDTLKIITIDTTVTMMGSAAFCQNDSVQMVATAGTGNTYQWRRNGADISGATKINYYATTSGTYKVVITTSLGCKDSSSGRILTANPGPGAHAGSATSICNGSSASLGAASSAGLTYSWASSPSGFTSTSANPNVSPATTTTYTVTTTKTSTGCSSSDSVKITVNPLPAASAGSSSSICTGGSTSIGSAANSGSTYSWVSSPSGFSSTASSNTVSPSSTTTYTVTESVTATGCQNSNSTTITVNALPAANAGSDASIGLGNSATIGSASVSGSTYTWTSSPSGYSSTASTASVSPTTTTTYSITETNAAGCSKSNSVTITVNPLPTASIGSGSTICKGTAATVAVTITNVGNSENWKLDYTEGSSSKNITGTGPGGFTITTSTLSSNTTVTLTGITNTTTTYSQSVSGNAIITVNPLPSASIGSGSAVCKGATGTVVVAISNVGASDNWKLDYTEGSTSKSITGTGTGNFNITTAALNANTTVTLTGVTNTTTTCSQSVSGSATITVNSLPSASIGSGSSVCNGTKATVAVTISNVGNTDNWQLDYTEGSTSKNITGTGPGSANITTVALIANTTVSLTGITNTTTTCSQSASGSATVTVNPLPVASIGSGSTICSGSTATVVVTISSVGSSDNWKLSYTEGSTSKSITGTGTGNFNITTSTLNANTTVTLTGIQNTTTTCSQSASGSATITVNKLPTASIGSGSTICSGTTATAAVTISNVGSSDNWKLSYSEGSTSKSITGTGTGNFNITTSALSANTTVTLTGIQNTTTTCSQSASGSATITINPLPAAAIGSGSTICSGNTATVVVTVSGVASTDNWKLSYKEGSTAKNITGTGTGSFNITTSTLSANTTVTLTGMTNTTTSCSQAVSGSATITVNPLPAAVIGSGSIICSGNTATVVATISSVGSSDNWKLSYTEGSTAKTITGTGTGNFNISTSVLSASTTLTLTGIQNTTTTCSQSASGSATITVNPLPSAVLVSGTSVCKGSTATVMVTVSNITATDIWRLNYTEGSTAKVIAGLGTGTFNITTGALSSNTTLTLNSIQDTTTTCTQALSSSVNITVTPTTVGGTTSGTATVCYSGNSGSVTLSGSTGSIVKWQYSTDGGTTWIDIANTTSSQSYTNLTTTTQYRAVVQSGICAAATSSVTTITVNPLPTATISGSTSICSGSTATLSVTVGNTGGASWSLGYLEGTSSKTLTGTGNGNFSLTTGTLTSNTDITLQGIALTSGSPLCSNSSFSGSYKANVTVNPIPAASISGSQTICTGNTPSFNVNISNVPSGNSWTLSYNEGSTAKTLTGTGSGSFAMNPSSLTNSGSSSATVTYTLTNIVNNTNSPSCNNTSFTGTYVVTVNPATTGGSLSGTTTLCGTVNSGSMSLSGNVGSVVRWEYSTDGGTTWDAISNTTTSQSYTNLATTTMYRTLVQSGVCNTAYSGTAAITVNPQPTASISGTQTICSGTAPSINVTVSNVASGQSWSLSYNEGGTGRTLTGSGSGSFALNTSSLSNATASQTTVSYALSTITNTSLSCTSIALSSTATVKVDPATVGGTLSASTTAVCNGTNSGTVKLSGEVGNITRWEFSTDGGATWMYLSNTNNSFSFTNLAATTTYRVLVQSGTCSSAYSATQTIIVNPLPVATISGNASICPGNTSVITFTVSNVGATDNWSIGYTVNGVAKTFTGTGAGSFTYTTPVMTYPPLNVVYNLVSISNATTGCNNNASGSAIIQVNPNPVVNYSFKNGCFGVATDFVNKSSIPVGNINSYQWDFGDGNISTDLNPQYSYAAAGTYNAKLVVYSGNGCKDSLSQSVTVYPKPSASFTYKNTCESDSAQFASTSSIAPGSIKTSNWNFGDTSTSALTSPGHKYNVAGTFSVNLNVISDKGCSSSATEHITVYPMPTANFAFAPVCEYDSMHFINQSIIPYGNLTYKWTFEPSSISTGTQPAHKFSSSGYFPVQLIAISNYGCKDSITRYVTANPKPVASFTTKEVCIAQSNTFNNTSTVSSGSINTILWNLGDSSSLIGNSVTHTYRHYGSYDVVLVVQTNNGCVDTITKTVTVHPLPPAKITAGSSTSFCLGGSVTLSAPSGLLYNWSTGATSQSITVNKSGEYNVSTTDPVGCSNNDSVGVIVYALPVASAGHDTTISKGFSAILQGSGGINYSWSPLADLDNPNAQNPVATPLETTTYTLTLSDIHGCTATDTVTVNVVTDYKVITYNTITPNGDGVNDTWTIDNDNTYKGATVTIYNRYGQVIYTTDNYQNDWGGTFNGQNLPQGTYYYTITFKDNDKVYKGAINILRN